MTRDFRVVIFNAFVCTSGHFTKDVRLEETNAGATLANWSQKFT